MSLPVSDDELGVLEQLKQSVETIVSKTGPSSKFSKDLVKRIVEMQSKLESLAETDRHQFLAEMKDKFQETIGRIEERIVQHAHIAQTYSSSIVSAVIFLLVSIFGLSSPDPKFQPSHLINCSVFLSLCSSLRLQVVQIPDGEGAQEAGEAQEQATEEGQEVQLKEKKMRRRGGGDVPNVVLSGPETFHLVNQYNRPVND